MSSAAYSKFSLLIKIISSSMTGNAATDGCFSVGLYSFTPGVHSNKDRDPLRPLTV